jgi:hypothetical protein
MIKRFFEFVKPLIGNIEATSLLADYSAMVRHPGAYMLLLPLLLLSANMKTGGCVEMCATAVVPEVACPCSSEDRAAVS